MKPIVSNNRVQPMPSGPGSDIKDGRIRYSAFGCRWRRALRSALPGTRLIDHILFISNMETLEEQADRDAI
jgi:hypothetical protein